MLIGSLILFGILFTLIMLHEAGHLIMAKKFDVKVATFSIGFGPRLIGVRFFNGKVAYRILNFQPSSKFKWFAGGTEYRLAPFLLGGFCAMEGEVKGDTERALVNKPFYQKFLIIMAGILVNITTGFAAIAGVAIARLGFLNGLKATCYAIYSMIISAYLQTIELITGAVPLARWEEITEASASMASWEGIILQFGFYSIIMGLFNALPLPALDGSYPFLWCLEGIFGKDRGRMLASVLVLVGFTLLMGLQLFIICYWIFV